MITLVPADWHPRPGRGDRGEELQQLPPEPPAAHDRSVCRHPRGWGAGQLRRLRMAVPLPRSVAGPVPRLGDLGRVCRGQQHAALRPVQQVWAGTTRGANRADSPMDASRVAVRLGECDCDS